MRQLNALAASLSLPLPALRPKAVDQALLGKLLRLLAKRCADGEPAQQFKRALEQFTRNGGALPPGMEFVEDAGVLETNTKGSPETPAAVPRHKC